VWDLPVGVLVPKALPSLTVKHGLEQDFPVDLMFLSAQLDVKLAELPSLAELVDDFLNALHPLFWVGNLVFLQISHFSTIRSEVLW
jgi:hypothetical protein